MRSVPGEQRWRPLRRELARLPVEIIAIVALLHLHPPAPGGLGFRVEQPLQLIEQNALIAEPQIPER